MLLNYVDEEVEDTVLKSKEEWDALKNNLGLNFPNLPYLIDDEVKLSQSSAILRYLGRKHKLNGKNDKEACEIDMLIETSTDLRITLAMQAYSEPDAAKMKENLKEQESKLKLMSDYLEGKKFLMGDQITIADFPMHDAITWYQKMDPEMVGQFKNLTNYIENFQSEPKNKSFLQGDRAFKAFFMPFAHHFNHQ